MPSNQSQVLPPPTGMATAMESSGSPPHICRVLDGMWPARLGIQKPRPIPKKLLHLIPATTGEQIQGYAIYRIRQTADPVMDLLIFTDQNLYVVPIYDRFEPAVTPFFTFAYLKYNRHPRGQTVQLALNEGFPGGSPLSFQQAPNGMATSDWLAGSVGLITNVASVQFSNELLFCGPTTTGVFATPNGIWRYYRDDAGVQHLYAVYIPAGGQPVFIGAETLRDPEAHLTGQYNYAWTWIDEQQRESSPSDPMTTPILTNQAAVIQRGVTTPYTAMAAISGWNLYRRAAGGTTYNRVNATPIPVATTLYTDGAADVSGGAVMPDFGENDPPDAATYLTYHKSRVVMNSTFNYGVVQLGNANSATQFASITLPTNTADGIRLDVGTDSEHVVTGLESIGDMLWIAKPSSYYLLQGDDITNWNLQEVGKNRGCDNLFSVQRTEELIPFKSSDGFYGLSYQAGMVSPKFSWEIDDLVNGFSSPLTPGEPQPFGGVFTPAATDGNTAGEPITTQAASRYIDFARSFYWQQRYFYCLPDRTLLYDMLTKGWADSGLGPVKWPVVYSGVQATNVTGAPTSSLPDTVFFSYGGSYEGSLDVYYFTSSDTAWDNDLATHYGNGFLAREVTRNFDPGDQEPLSGRIRGRQLTIYGKTGRPHGAKLGEVTCFADGRRCGGPIPLHAWLTIDKQGALCQVGLPNDFVGEELYFEFAWITNDLEISKRLLDIVRRN